MENESCETGALCLCGKCAAPCFNHECNFEQFCVNGFCVTDPCCGKKCIAGFHCIDGACASICALTPIECADGKYCAMNEPCSSGKPEECKIECRPDDCYSTETRCKTGELCINGKCKIDICRQVSCPKGGYCDQETGNCFPICDNNSCPDGQSCSNGFCSPDACAGVKCVYGKMCVQGKCTSDPCISTGCPAGQICLEGKCVANACEGITCPDDSVCQKGTCIYLSDLQNNGPGQNTENNDDNNTNSVNPGGCSCSVLP